MAAEGQKIRHEDEVPDFGDADYVPEQGAQDAVDAYEGEKRSDDLARATYVAAGAPESLYEDKTPEPPVKVSYLQDEAVEEATKAGHDIQFGGEHYPAQLPHDTEAPKE